MFRARFWRALCILALLGSVLQITGFFFPFSETINTVTNTKVDSDSYWTPLAHSIAGTTPSPRWITFSLFAFLSLLLPLGTALRELLLRPQRFSPARLSSLIIAILWFLQYILIAFGTTTMESFCVADQLGDCVLSGNFGSGFWPTCVGSLLSMGCFLALFTLGRIWWCRPTTREQQYS